jgi:hypothetical protein
MVKMSAIQTLTVTISPTHVADMQSDFFSPGDFDARTGDKSHDAFFQGCPRDRIGPRQIAAR